jgi:hypothetical protein
VTELLSTVNVYQVGYQIIARRLPGTSGGRGPHPHRASCTAQAGWLRKCDDTL